MSSRYLLLLTTLLVACGGGDRDVPQTFAIATGGPAGLYYPFGGGMASIWSASLPEVNARAEVTGGSVTNVIQVARRESELGIAMADVVTAAYLGQGRFPEPLPIRVLFNAYPNVVHILTLDGNGVERIRDLVGKRVSLGAAGSGTAVAAENVLAGLGIDLTSIAPIYLNFGETTAALKDGTIDAGFIVGGLGLAAVTELAVTRDLRLVALEPEDIEAIVSEKPAYSPFAIPAGTYEGVTDDVRALGIWSAVVVHEAFPEALAFKLACTIFRERAALLKVSPVAAATTVENMSQLAAVPLHPGAARLLADPGQECE